MVTKKKKKNKDKQIIIADADATATAAEGSTTMKKKKNNINPALFTEWTYAAQWRQQQQQKQSSQSPRNKSNKNNHYCIQDLSWYRHENKYLFLWACTRQGQVVVWDCTGLPSVAALNDPEAFHHESTNHDKASGIHDQSNKNRTMMMTSRRTPVWCQQITTTRKTTPSSSSPARKEQQPQQQQQRGGPLYKLHWVKVEECDDDVLLVAGQGGIFVLDAARILQEAMAKMTRTTTSTTAAAASDLPKSKKQKTEQPSLLDDDNNDDEEDDASYIISILPTYPHAWSIPHVVDVCAAAVVVMNNDAADPTPMTNTRIMVWGAVEDDFGAYQWELETGRVVRTFRSSDRDAHVTSVHYYCSNSDTAATAKSQSQQPQQFLCVGDTAGCVQVFDLLQQPTTTTSIACSTMAFAAVPRPVQSLTPSIALPVQTCRFWSQSNTDGNAIAAAAERDENATTRGPDWLVVAYGGEGKKVVNHRVVTTPTATTIITTPASRKHEVMGQIRTWHLPTESVVSHVDTPASMQCLHMTDDRIWTGANNGRVSLFTAFDLQPVQRNIPSLASTCPSIHAIATTTTDTAANSKNTDDDDVVANLTAVGGVGGTVDILNPQLLRLHQLSL